MPRSIRSKNLLEDRTNRLKLPVAGKPTFVKLEKGLHLGYRRNKTVGVWTLRIADGKGGNRLESLATADDYDNADGISVLTFSQASAAARERGKAIGVGGKAPRPTPQLLTVAVALTAYQADLESRGRDVANIARARRHLPAILLNTPVADLTSAELSDWRNSLTIEKASVNRVMTVLRAAFNLAASHDARLNDRAWKYGLKAFSGVAKANNVVISETEIRAIIAAANQHSAEFALLVEVAAVTGARCSQITRMRVQDLRDGPKLMIPVSSKGRGTKPRSHIAVPIPDALAAKLRVHAAGRASTSPLLVRMDGTAWEKRDETRPFARAVRAAGLDPTIVTMYSLRHSNIVRMIKAGVPIRIIAVVHDTSVRMIETNYSADIADHTDEFTRKAMLDLSVESANVVPLRKG